jgi:DNA-binding IclR family transcriptional regulator
MIQLARDPNLRIRDIAEAVGITERSAQAILVDLERGGYLTVTRVGRRNQYQINPNSKFRHPAEDEKPISALLKIFS